MQFYPMSGVRYDRCFFVRVTEALSYLEHYFKTFFKISLLLISLLMQYFMYLEIKIEIKRSYNNVNVI